VGDNELRALMLEGAKKGLAMGKVSEEDVRIQVQATGENLAKVPAWRLQVGNPGFWLMVAARLPLTPFVLRQVPSPKKVSVKVKVMRDLDKQPVNGIYQSRGYGFADFPSHAYALAALRHLNNNPEYFKCAPGGGSAARKKQGAVPRLMISFAIENQKKILKKQARQASAVQVADEGMSNGRAVTKAKESRGRKQREKRRAGVVSVSQGGTSMDGVKAQAGKSRPDRPQTGAMIRSAPTKRRPLKRAQDELDQLATAAPVKLPDDAPSSKRRRRHGADQGDEKAFTALVAEYKERLFGQGKRPSSLTASAAGQRPETRWFDETLG
jgi:RNA recognition motif-containing protein